MRFNQRRPSAKIRQQAYNSGKCRISKLEMLERRALLTGNATAALAPLHNPALAQDVNHDGYISPLDALLLISDLRQHGPHSVQTAAPLAAAAGTAAATTMYLDVNGDNVVSAADALSVINRLAITATTSMTVHTFATDLAGNPITSPITVGTQFIVETDVQDTRNPVNAFPGVGSAFLNFTYDSSVVSVDNPSGGQVPIAGPGFSISGTKPLDLSVPNQITDEGAFASGAGPTSPVVQKLFTFTATATASGTITFTPFFDSLPHHDTSFFNPVDDLTSGDISFIGDSIQVVALPLVAIAPGPSINQANTGTTNFVFTVSLSQAPLTPVTVQFATADGAGGNGASHLPPDVDYNATSGTLTFNPADSLTQLVTVTVNADAKVEAPETFSLVLSSPSPNAQLSPNSAAVGTILNDSISIGDVNVTNTVVGTNAVFTLSLSVAPTVPVTVRYQVVPGTAVLGTDYAPPAGGTLGTLTFNPTVTTQFLTVPIIGNAFPDVSEQFQVVLSTPTNAILNNGQATETATGTIAPAVAIPSLSITPQVSHPNTAPLTDFVFTVSLSNPVNSESLFVKFETADGTATHESPDIDYNATSGTLTFVAGTTQQFVTVQVPGNAASEPNETFTVNLTPISTDVTGTPSGTGLIISQKGTPTLSLSSPTVTPGSTGANALFTVSLNFPVTTIVTVPYATQDNTAHDGIDYQAQSGQLTFTPGDASLTQIITVPVIGQSAAASNESFFLNLSPPDPSDGLIEANSTGVATIVRQGLTIADASAKPGTNAVFTVSLSQAQGTLATVSFNTADGTGTNGATAGTDYTATSGILTFQPGQTTQTITVPILPSVVVEPNETFTVNLSNPSGGAQILSGQATGTILNQQGQRAAVQLKLADTSGNLLPANTVLSQGQNFLLEVFVQDTQTVPTGIFQAYVNALYDSRLVQPTSGASITYGTGFDNNRTGDLSTLGQVIDAGAFQLAPPASPGSQQLLVRIPLTATNFGLATFSVDSSTAPLHDFAEFVTNVIPAAQINFINSADNPLAINIGNNVFSVDNVTHVVGPAGSLTPFVFDVTRFLPNGTTATVVVSTHDDVNGAHSATAGQDYIPLSTTLTFSGTGTSETQQVTVFAIGTNVLSPDETFLVNLSSPTNAQASAAPGIGTISTGFPPKIAVAGDSESEGQILTFTVSLNAPSSQITKVNYTTALATSGTIALPNVNFIPTSGILTFLPGVTTQTISVQSLYTLAQATDETFKVVLSNPTNADLATTPDEAIGTIKVIPPATITGLVYVDANGNGRVDAGEGGIPGVTVTAIRNGNNRTSTTVTQADGSFTLSGLEPGTYTIRETQPGFFVDGIDSRFGVVSPFNDQFSNITVASAQTASGFDFGEAQLKSQFAAAFLNRRAYFASSILTGELGSQATANATNLMKGDIWISFDTGLPGSNTIKAAYNAAGGSAKMMLYSSDLTLVAQSSVTATGSQLTFTGTGTGAYFLHITGSNQNVVLSVTTTGGASPSASPAAFAAVASSLAATSTSSATDSALAQETDWHLGSIA